MSRVRLYLTSKINILDDVTLLKPADHKPSSTSKLERKECCLNGDETKSQTLSKLEERRKIISEQDAAYEEPLATDKAKREKLMKEVKLWSVKQQYSVHFFNDATCSVSSNSGRSYFLMLTFLSHQLTEVTLIKNKRSVLVLLWDTHSQDCVRYVESNIIMGKIKTRTLS